MSEAPYEAPEDPVPIAPPAHTTRNRFATTVAAALLACVPAAAQVVPCAATPGVSDAAVRATESRPSSIERRVERAVPTAPTEGLDRAARAADDDESAANVTFRVSRIVFEGNTVIDDDELKPLARPYERRTVTLTQLRELCLKIRNLYRSRGYILARAGVPPQRVESGRVKIAISEGRYGKIRVEGNEHYSEGFIRRFFEPAVEEGVVRQRSVERRLLVLNSFMDLKVRSQFDIGRAPGTTDVVLKVEDESPQHFGFDFNNYGNRLVGRNRAGLGMWRGNALRYGDELYLHATFPFPSRSEPFLNFSYSMPLWVDGDRLIFSASRANTRVGEELEILDIRGEATIGSIEWLHALDRTLHASSNLHLGLTSKDVKNFIFDNQLVSDDRLRMAVLGYDRNWIDGTTRTVLSGYATVGLDEFLGGMPRNSVLSSRPGAGADNHFTRFNGDFLRLGQIVDGTYWLVRLSGQMATQPLAVPEQFVVGGPDSVRGFMQSAFLGDDGFTGSLELRQSLLESEDYQLQVLGFVDHGYGRISSPLVNERDRRSLTGVGPGLRLGYKKYVTIRLDLGLPVGGRLPSEETSILHAQLVSRF